MSRARSLDAPIVSTAQSELEQAVFRAVVGDDVEALEALHAAGANLTIFERSGGNTPLHIACSSGARRVARLLVELAADINARNNEQKTPLHSAVERKWADLAKWLVYQGADLYPKDRNGLSVTRIPGWPVNS